MKGKVTNIDTSKFKKGEDLYLDPSKPGCLTNKRPDDNDGDFVWDDEAGELSINVSKQKPVIQVGISDPKTGEVIEMIHDSESENSGR